MTKKDGQATRHGNWHNGIVSTPSKDHGLVTRMVRLQPSVRSGNYALRTSYGHDSRESFIYGQTDRPSQPCLRHAYIAFIFLLQIS